MHRHKQADTNGWAEYTKAKLICIESAAFLNALGSLQTKEHKKHTEYNGKHQKLSKPSKVIPFSMAFQSKTPEEPLPKNLKQAITFKHFRK